MKESPNYLTKSLYAIKDFPKLFEKTPKKLFMTLLVKDEDDILETNLLFHHAMGVDGFIVTDNNSSDNTPSIIEKYREKGWIKHVIHEPHVGYEQKRWVDRMVWIAKTQYGADWVINADADELWCAPSGNLKQELAKAQGYNVLSVPIHNVLPIEGEPLETWNLLINPVEAPTQLGLSPYSIYGKNKNGKVAHRTAGYIQIAMGNHKVTMFPHRNTTSDIRIYHYIYRGIAHFTRKVVNGGKAMEQRGSRHGGRHWRYFYEIYKQGHLNEEYAKVVGTDILPALIEQGIVIKDNTIPDIFKQIHATR